MKHVMLLIFIFTSHASVAAIYQWTDEQGITHFSDNESISLAYFSKDFTNPI